MTQYEEMRQEAMAWDQQPKLPSSMLTNIKRLAVATFHYIRLRF